MITKDEINTKGYVFLENVPGGYPMDVTYINLSFIMAPKLREFDIDAGKMILVFEDGHYDIFVEESKWLAAGQKILADTLRSDEIIKSWEKRTNNLIKYMSKSSKYYASIDFSSLSDKCLYKELENILVIEKKYPEEGAEMGSTNYGTNLIYKELEKNLKELGYEPNKTAQILLRATGDFPILEYEKELGKLALWCHKNKLYNISEKDSKNKDLNKKIKEILSKYGWLDASIVNEPKSKKGLLAELNDLLAFKSNLDKVLNDKEKEQILKKKEKEVLLKEILSKASTNQKRAIYFAITSAELGRVLVDELMLFIYHRRGIYSEIAKRLKISEIETKFMVVEEIKDCLINKKKPNMQAINERKKLAVCILGNNEANIISGEKALKIKLSLKALVKDDNSPLKGDIAYSKGTLKGIAKLVKNASEMSKVEKGDILVSSRTYPDLLPAMKRSSAIIAELGGLLSHAAIVARELHIPCVVGVRNAMSRIKDNDLIEVDTEKGTIRIMNKK